MTVVCCYPIEGSVAAHRLIHDAIKDVTNRTGIQCTSVFSGDWRTTVSGLTETEEVHFKFLVCDRCTVYRQENAGLAGIAETCDGAGQGNQND